MSKDYREWLARRIGPLITAHGLDRSRRTEAPPRFRTRGTWAPESWQSGQAGHSDGLIGAELGPASPQPTLF